MTIDLRRTEIIIHRAALTAIFDECDRHDREETGGRLVGAVNRDDKGHMQLTLSGVIDPGPDARRSRTSLFQDGAYQERAFRALEQRHPDIEHLGNWHTHHVNGHPTLSQGDLRTYRNIVNSKKHNTDLFYALLVTRKRKDATGDDRYAMRHYLFARGQRDDYEVPQGRIRVIDAPLLVAGDGRSDGVSQPDPRQTRRSLDHVALRTLAPALKPYRSKAPERVYWRGPLTLLDGSAVDLVVAESPEPGGGFHVVMGGGTEAMREAVAACSPFTAAIEAVVMVERRLNALLYAMRPATPAEANAPPPVPAHFTTPEMGDTTLIV